MTKFVDVSQAKNAKLEVLSAFHQSHPAQVVTEEEFKEFNTANNLNLNYKTMCKGEVMLKDELIMGLMFITKDQPAKRESLVKTILEDDKGKLIQRKLMHMVEWKYQLIYKNIPEEVYANSKAEDKEELSLIHI